jgi:DNA-binding MarR family transcriptional regulator
MTLSIPGTGLCHCAALRKAARTVTQHYDGHLEPVGLRISQYSMLLAVARKPGLSVNDLAAALVLDRTTTGRNIKPLERAGLLEIEVSRSDARSRTVHLTKKGREVVRKAVPLWERAQADLEGDYGMQAVKAIRDALIVLKDA